MCVFVCIYVSNVINYKFIDIILAYMHIYNIIDTLNECALKYKIIYMLSAWSVKSYPCFVRPNTISQVTD